jgi:lipid-A-disaccharide synthase
LLTSPNPRIFLSAGEASGDHYGAQILSELRNRQPGLTSFGLGGRELEEAGLERIVRAEDVAHMGITEVIRHIPYIYGEYRRLVAAIKEHRPDVAILIDFPDVNLRLARELKKLSVPVVYFVSPQLWAWKRRRLHWVQERVDRMMVIFPFEEKFYRARGVDAAFVGHPLAELPKPTVSRGDYAAAHGLDPEKEWIALLPGSRWKEVTANVDVMIELAHQLSSRFEFLLPVAATIDRQKLEAYIAGPDEWWPAKPESDLKRLHLHLVPDAREALHHARASVVASGTATVQAAVLGNPFVVVYRVSPITFRLAKHLVRYPSEIWPSAQTDAEGNLPIAMVNLIAGRRIVPELLQDRFTAKDVATALAPLLAETPEREQMIIDLAEVRDILRPGLNSSSIRRVCDGIDELLARSTPTSGRNVTASV